MTGLPQSRTTRSGWPVVAALGIVLAVSVGISFYGASVYLEALTRGPSGFSLATVSGATSGFLLVSGVAGVGVGVLLDRADPRSVLCGGAVVAAVALLVLGRVRTAPELVLAYAALGIGFAATSTIPASTLVTAWFPRQRALALSLAFTGLPLGGALLTPAIAALVQSRGVAGAAPWLAGGYLVGVVPVTLAVVRPAPQARAAPLPEGVAPQPPSAPDPPSAAELPSAAGAGATVREAVRSSWFWVVTVALMLGMLGQVGALSHLYNAVTERLGPTAAATAISTMAVASLAGRVAGSWALGRLPLVTATVALLVGQAVATVGIAAAPSRAAVLACTVAFGLAVGNMQVLHPLLVAEFFGDREYSRILSLSALGVAIGMAVGPLVVGAVRTVTGSYLPGIAAAAGSAAVAAVLVASSAGRHRAPEPALPVAAPGTPT